MMSTRMLGWVAGSVSEMKVATIRALSGISGSMVDGMASAVP
jgi:hypothetical protein